MRKSILFCLLVCVVLFGTTVSAQDTKTIVFAFPADSTTFNTVIQVESVDSAVQSFVFPYLATNDPVTGQPKPYLTEWQVSDDGLTYTFHINDNANWSDGVPITSADVAFTLNAMFSDKVETFRTIDGLDSINVIDDKDFTIVLTHPTCGLFDQIGMGIMPAHKFASDYSDFTTSDFNTHPDISGGPFKLVERSVDEFLRFEANDTFFEGRPEIDQLLLKVIVDDQVRLESMKNGESDWIMGLISEQAKPFMNDPRFTVTPVESNSWIVAIFNLADPAQPMPAHDDKGNLVEQPPHPVLGDPRVRQALIEGWNHDDAVFLVGEGARRLVGPVAPILTDAYDNNLQLYPYDPADAAKLLDEAGWVLKGDVREKDGVPLKIELVYLNAFGDIASVVADYWKKLGVDVTLTTGEQGAILSDHVYPQNFDVFMVSVSWNAPTPDVLVNFLWNSKNDLGSDFGSFVNEEYDSVLAQLSTAACTVEARQPLYYRLQEILHEQAPTDFISTVVEYEVTNSRISNAQFASWGYTPIWQWHVSN